MIRVKEIIQEKKAQGRKILLKELAAEVFPTSSHPYIKLNRILEGKTNSIEVGELKQIAEYLEVGIDELFYEKRRGLTDEEKDYLFRLVCDDARIESDDRSEDFKRKSKGAACLAFLFGEDHEKTEHFINIISQQ